MKWFIAKLVFQINIEETQRMQFDETLRLIQAADADEAFFKARVLGVQEEETFLNDKQQLVKWEFINVSNLYPLRQLADGVELYSQIHETTAAEESIQYINSVHQRAVWMQTHETAMTSTSI